MKKLFTAALFTAALFASGPAAAEEPALKIGLIGPFSGPSLESGGMEFDGGIKTFLKIHGDTVAGRKVEIIRRDVPNPMPDLAKRSATELVVRDKVDFLTGVIFTPNALAVGQVSGETGTPLVIMNAATTGIMAKIPNAVRMSFTLSQAILPLGAWAARNGHKRAFTLVADYAPGIDAENAFSRTFTEGGGQVVEKLRVPLVSTEFSSYVRSIKDSKADAVFLFLPTSDTARAFLKAFKDAGLADSVRVLADGGVTAPQNLAAMGDEALGVISSHHYTETHDSPENNAFVKVFAEENGGRLPTYIAVAAYDAMAAMYKVTQAQQGKLTLKTTMEQLSNLQLQSPRGPIQISPATRDITQNIYIRKVEKRGGRLVNVEIETLKAVTP
jgi:branched-chain amino acid transport system substrate-binding protein